MTLIKSLKSLSHHAYCLIGGDSIHSELISILEEKHSIKIHGNPDLFDGKFESLTIDDVREIKSIHETKPVTASSKKIFIITTSVINVEAQNALLKILEEPAEYAIFFLIIPSAHILLPTVKSRVHIIGTRKELTNNTEDLKEAEKFLGLSSAKRLEIMKALIEDISKERKTKQDAIDLLNAIQLAVYEKKGVKTGKSSLEAIEIARKYAGDRSPSLKMLLEYVALAIG